MPLLFVPWDKILVTDFLLRSIHLSEGPVSFPITSIVKIAKERVLQEFSTSLFLLHITALLNKLFHFQTIEVIILGVRFSLTFVVVFFFVLFFFFFAFSSFCYFCCSLLHWLSLGSLQQLSIFSSKIYMNYFAEAVQNRLR